MVGRFPVFFSSSFVLFCFLAADFRGDVSGLHTSGQWFVFSSVVFMGTDRPEQLRSVRVDSSAPAGSSGALPAF